jgi:hypothetical protein
MAINHLMSVAQPRQVVLERGRRLLRSEPSTSGELRAVGKPGS